MNPRTTIAVCYRAGTKDMLKVWLLSVVKYTSNPVNIFIVTADFSSSIEALDVCGLETKEGFLIDVVQVTPDASMKPRIHGAMLDLFLAKHRDDIKSEFFMTMDSDCFPVASGWLEGLEGMMDNGARIAGILHPWGPPPADMSHTKLEWRVRIQHCWTSTHVACQMIRLADLKELNVTYAKGDDTGMLIPLEANKRGWKIDGYKISRGPKPRDDSDPEFNRYVCLIFGDKVYHHGGFTRITTDGSKPTLVEAYGWVLSEILSNKGAEFLLCDDSSYQFKLDREEEVAADKISRLFGAKTMGLK